MINKVYIFVNYNLYESKRHFVTHMTAALRRQGIETILLDTGKERLSPEFFLEMIKHKPAFTCSFNSILPLKPDTSYYLCDYLSIPHWSILLDPSIYAVQQTESPWLIMSCVDRNDCDGLTQYGFQNNFFWPHAIEADMALQSDAGERLYDVAFTGSCYDYKSLHSYWHLHIPEVYAAVLDDAAARVLAPGYTSLMQGLVQAWSSLKADPHGYSLSHLFLCLDYYTRGLDRVELVRAIARHHPVHIFGAPFHGHISSVLSWQNYLRDYPQAIVHPAVEFGAAIELMRQSKIYLNSMPFFKDGSHERILAALACGALPVTSDSKWVRENFVDGEDLIIYTADEREHIWERIAPLLADEGRRRAMVARGRQKVLQHHTWDQRVISMLEEMPPILARMPVQASRLPVL